MIYYQIPGHSFMEIDANFRRIEISRKNYGKIIGNFWKFFGKITAKLSEIFGKFLGKLRQNYRKFLENFWENYEKIYHS